MESTALAGAGTSGTAEPRHEGSFYRDGGAPVIMSAAHFPDEFLSFFQMEGLTAREAVSRYACDSLVELGCYDGRALEVAKAADIAYLGVDVSRNAIDVLNRRIADEGLQDRARAVLGDMLHSGEWAAGISGSRPLHLVPFNLLGNFPEPEKVIASLSAVGGMALISVFNDDARTTTLRRAYYSTCGIGDLEEVPGEYGGVAFCGKGGFRSQSFSEEGMNHLFTAGNATLVTQARNRLGRCVVVRFD
ncbi:hypothetical protein [Streptomyces luteolus]|uniref:SAM-dependent methyltransferase n=1 Tax=Streptomyces luteolus TaxID=3043615 RepID=A0ABT6T5H6_9ACTN|nr:hypothetical protein [Streptomyces sp. B-S-A12]MDI3422648.1 hypothetical protein [Streptomyces sp. B-S-A12]